MTEREPDRVEGEIQVDEQGNVTIGAPTAVAIVVPPDDGEEATN